MWGDRDMRLKNKTIYFKSSEPFFTKEMKGIKNNTVRTLDSKEGMLLLEYHIEDIKHICIESVETRLFFVRTIKDISFYADRWIFTWEG